MGGKAAGSWLARGGVCLWVLLAAGAGQTREVPPWLDPALPTPRRVDLVLGQMTLDEKIGMVHGNFGSILRKSRPDDKRIGAGHVPGVPRLGIPDLYESDASLGVANGGTMRPGDVATALPASLATAASFDPDIAYEGGAMIGAEARAKGFNVLLAGGANLTRDPWNGRNFEYMGEDTWLTGVMAGAAIRGVQDNGIISTVKHFALNAQESGRYVLDARIEEPALRESDLLAFQLAMERGQPDSVMCAYNKVNGDWSCENDWLLNQVLKRDWGFSGWVMSDWGGVHSTAKAALAGLDQESGQELDQEVYFGEPLRAAVQSGAVPAARLDDMVRRILGRLFDRGLVDRPAPETPQAIDYAAHGQVARRAAEAGAVLLRNEGGLLPLSTALKRVVVIGGHADIGVLSGGGSSQVQAVSGTPLRLPIPNGPANLGFIKVTYHGSSPLAAIKARLPGAQVSYLDGHDPAAAAVAARDADAVLVFAEQWRTEAIDLESPALPDGQDALIAAVAAANPRTTVVLETGGAVLMPWLGKVGAVLEAWYPGDQGGEAIARVLFGEVDAGGRLPLTFPATEAQAPRPRVPGLANVKAAAAQQAAKPRTPGATTVDITGGVQGFDVPYVEGADVGYRWYERQGSKPLFPFGHGLSYSRFRHGGFTAQGGARPTVRFTVTNIGSRPGVDVPQVYAVAAGADGKPLRRLVAFKRVELAPGQSVTVTLPIDPRLIARYDAGAWTVRGGPVPVVLARDAGDAGQTASLTLPALTLKP
ncbi:beta-glucosidase family protein [Nitrospirillum iridis]|uniref:Beta-glucosidase n=1 Tax=Nitrospirillum iridis TaxID=765888 RepID=A0A7X0EDR1_9PROT|nr:beta-glucosidase [Nitrospirillum iridis]MBB6253062.1 beta-glucosidase [Nitrospirillum iridis]